MAILLLGLRQAKSFCLCFFSVCDLHWGFSLLLSFAGKSAVLFSFPFCLPDRKDFHFWLWWLSKCGLLLSYGSRVVQILPQMMNVKKKSKPELICSLKWCAQWHIGTCLRLSAFLLPGSCTRSPAQTNTFASGLLSRSGIFQSKHIQLNAGQRFPLIWIACRFFPVLTHI